MNLLSQEEIDALLGGNSRVSEVADLSAEEEDVLSEIGNINAGSAATALSELLNQRVIINCPTLTHTTMHKLNQEFDTPYLLIKIEFTSGIAGYNLFILKSEDAAIIANLMMGGDGLNLSPDMDELTMSAISEAMNQMIGFSATSLSQIFERTIEISPPQVQLISTEDDVSHLDVDISEQVVVISFLLQIGDLIESQIMLVISLDIAKEHVKYLIQDTAQELDSLAPEPKPQNNVDQNALVSQEANALDQGTMLIDSGNLDLILDVPLRLSVILGRTRRCIADILKMNHGTIIELERLENEPVDILVNEKLIARGEVVVVKEYFGVRITEILSTENRLKNLVPK